MWRRPIACKPTQAAGLRYSGIMVTAERRKSIALFIALGAGLILVILLLYIGWVLLNWRTGVLLFLGVLLLAVIIGGVVLNTIFLVREIRRNEQQRLHQRRHPRAEDSRRFDPPLPPDPAVPSGG